MAQKKKPSDHIRIVREFLLIFSHIIGVHMPSNKKYTPRFIFTMAIGSIWFTMYLNGFYYSLGDPIKLLHATLTNVFMFSILGRVVIYVHRNCDVLDSNLQAKTEKFYEKWERFEKYRDKLMKRAKEAEFYTKLLTYTSFILYMLPTIPTAVIYLTTGEKFLYINNYMPFTDPKGSLAEFLINYCFMIVAQSIYYFGLITGDNMFVFYCYQLIPMCDILCNRIIELGDELTSMKVESLEELEPSLILYDLSTQNINLIESTKDKLIKIIQEHREFDQFVMDLVYFDEIPCFLATAFNSLSIGASIVTSFEISLSVGILFGVVYVSQVFIPCLIGTLISTQKKRILNKLCEFPWWELSNEERRIYLEFIHVVQYTTEFRIPVLGLIDMEAFTKVMNASYSYFTFFFNFAKK